jgi:hypothetical protein
LMLGCPCDHYEAFSSATLTLALIAEFIENENKPIHRAAD